MLNIRFSPLHSLITSCALLLSPLPLSAMSQDIIVKLSNVEQQYITENSDHIHIYLGKDVSNIIHVLLRIKDLDNNQSSPLHAFAHHIEQGFVIEDYDTILEILNYAETILDNNHSLHRNASENLHHDFEILVHQVLHGELHIDPHALETTRAHHHHLPTQKINKNLKVLGKGTFHKHLRTRRNLTAKRNLKVGKSGMFGGDVRIGGMLSASDAIINNAIIENLTITTSVLDSVINNLTVTFTLSANDAIIANATTDNLTAANAVIDNLTVTNCISNLCVNNISIDDASISGIVSVDDI